MKQIITDNRSGSKAILNQIMEELQSFQDWDNPKAVEKVKENLLKVLDKHTILVVIFHFINSLFLEIEKSRDHRKIREFINIYKDNWKNASIAACQHLLNDLSLTGKNILLHSNSSSVQEFFAKMPKGSDLPRIFQTVSGPVNEGLQQAEIIARLGFSVELIHENAIENFIRQIDVTIFGTDLITEHFFVNKAGTFPLTLVFQHNNKPVYLLADSRKIINVSKLPEKLKNKFTIESEKPANELWNGSPEPIQVTNYYFDKTPVELLSGIFIETGAILPEKIPAVVGEMNMAKEIKYLFR